MILDGLSIALLLAIVGVALIAAEVLFPSGGVLGFLAAASLLGAVYSAYTEGGWLYGLGFATAEVLIAPAAVYLTLLYLPKTPIGRVLIGTAPTSDEVQPEDDRRALVGRIGIARSKMLPAGSVEVDGEMLDAVSRGQAIEPGEYVRIAEVRGNRVVVRRATEEDLAARRSASGEPIAGEPNALQQPVEELGLDSLGLESLDFTPPPEEPPQQG